MGFQKGNTIGNRFTSENQPKKCGRKPSVYKYIKTSTGKKVEAEMSKEDYLKVIQFLMELTTEDLEMLIKGNDGKANKKTPVWVLNVGAAILADVRYGRTTTLEALFDRVFGKATQTIEGDLTATTNVNPSVDLSALSVEEMNQYNMLLEKMAKGRQTEEPQEQ